MQGQPPRRSIRRVVPAVWVAAVLAICCAGTAVAAVSSSSSRLASQKLAGKWKGHYSGALSGRFTIRWKQTGSKLSGTITLSNPQGKYGIGGSVRHGKIKFGAVAVGATYKGSVHGTSMSGTWNSPKGGGGWSAHKVLTG